MNTGRTHFKAGMVPWNKGKHIRLRPLGYKHSEETLKKLTTINKELGLRRKGIMPKNLDTLIGKNHWNWKGGISKIDKLIRGTSLYSKWREHVFKRDNYKCQDCGVDKCYVTAHHIKSFAVILKENNIKSIEDAINCPELWDIKNGKTLCEDCHKLTDNYKGRGMTHLTLYQNCGLRAS